MSHAIKYILEGPDISFQSCSLRCPDTSCAWFRISCDWDWTLAVFAALARIADRVLAAEYPGSSIEWIRFRLWLWNDNSREWRRADLPSWHAWLSCHPEAGWNLLTKVRGWQMNSTFHQISVCPCVTLWWRMLPQWQCLLYLRRWSEVLVWKGSRCLAAVWTIWSLNRLPLY